MSYCSAQDIRNALNPDGVNNNSNTAADLTDTALMDCAEEASATIDAYIDGPYDPTVESIPPIVKFWARNIGAYLATLTWRGAKAPAPNSPVVIRYQNTMGMLESVITGELAFPTPMNVEDQATIINPNLGGLPTDRPLITANEFDLTGRQEDLPGWPLTSNGIAVFWPGFET